MINNISVNIQRGESKYNSDFSNNIFELLESTTNAKVLSENSITLGSETLKPNIILNLNSDSTLVSFNDNSNDKYEFKTGGLVFGKNINKSKGTDNKSNKYEIKNDSIGDYCEVEYENDKYYQLTSSQLLKRFKGKINEVNHIGINFSASEISKVKYLDFKRDTANSCFLVKYPTGEEWPFIIPCTEEEYRNEITDFNLKRNPKFEIVYSNQYIIPVIQFDIHSNLTKEEVLKVLPEPYGISFPELEDYYRTVYINTDFKDLLIRFDIRFFSKNNKDFYKWLINKGGRIKASEII